MYFILLLLMFALLRFVLYAREVKEEEKDPFTCERTNYCVSVTRITLITMKADGSIFFSRL